VTRNRREETTMKIQRLYEGRYEAQDGRFILSHDFNGMIYEWRLLERRANGRGYKEIAKRSTLRELRVALDERVGAAI
jgi:hypothetical protein